MGVFGTLSRLGAVSVAVALVISCGGKAGDDGDDDATGGRRATGGRETTGDPGADPNTGGRAAGSGGTSGGATDTPVLGGGPGEPDPEQPFSDPIPVGEVPTCNEEAPPLLEGYTYHALYRFEEPRGATLEDTIGIGQGTIQGASRSEGECGRGVSFSADGAHLELTDLGDVFQDGIAVGLWVRPTSLVSGEAHLVGDGPWGVTSFQLFLDDGVPVLRIADSNYAWHDLLRASDPLELDAWQYIQVAYNSDTAELFIDGREIATSNLVYTIQGSYNLLYVGATATIDLDPCCPYERSFVGDLDEIAIYAAQPPL